jgi:hypothetical protein
VKRLDVLVLAVSLSPGWSSITYHKAVSHVARIQQLNPKMERKPNLRCRSTSIIN